MADDIHPPNKQDVGKRLARWALAQDYGQDVLASGPLYKSYQVQGDKIRVEFEYGDGLKARDGAPLQRFIIAGEDRVFRWAKAEIDGAAVVVSHPEVKEPKAVRYAWEANAERANLVNGEGLPTSVFRTDDWPLATDNIDSPFSSAKLKTMEELQNRR